MAILGISLPHGGPALTGREMYRLCRNYHGDLRERAGWPLPKFFEHVRAIPYREDGEVLGRRQAEILCRPLYMLDRRIFPALDCKKKSILIGAWAAANGIPYRFVATSETGSRIPHHVFPQLKIQGEWVNVDPTLPGYEIGQGKPGTTAAYALEAA